MGDIEHKHKPWSSTVWWGISIVLVLLGMGFIFLYLKHPRWGNHFQVIGSVSSALGLVFAVLQVIHARRASEDTAEAVKGKLSDLNCYFSYADVSKCGVLVDEIENIARQRSPHALHIKLKELKDNLIDFQLNPNMNTYKRDLESMVFLLRRDISSCSLASTSSSKIGNAVEYDAIIDHAEQIKTLLITIASKLKYQKYE